MQDLCKSCEVCYADFVRVSSRQSKTKAVLFIIDKYACSTANFKQNSGGRNEEYF